jgi:hypothetical protein
MTFDGEERNTMDLRREVGEAVVASSIMSGQIEFKLSTEMVSKCSPRNDRFSLKGGRRSRREMKKNWGDRGVLLKVLVASAMSTCCF